MIYLDTSVILHLLDPEAPRNARAVEATVARGSELATSHLIFAEVLPRGSRSTSVTGVEQLLGSLRMYALTEEVCRRAGRFCVEHGLKSPDALHLAASAVNRCAEVWTFEARLLRLGAVEGVAIREP